MTRHCPEDCEAGANTRLLIEHTLLKLELLVEAYITRLEAGDPSLNGSPERAERVPEEINDTIAAFDAQYAGYLAIREAQATCPYRYRENIPPDNALTADAMWCGSSEALNIAQNLRA